MKSSWMWVALASSAFLVGCGDRGRDSAQNTEDNAPAVASETALAPETGPAVTPPAPAPVALPRRDGSNPRPTTGIRPGPADPRSVEAPAHAPELPSARATRPGSSPSAAAASPSASSAPRWREVTVPAGTALPLELLTALSSETAQVEMPVRARLRQGVVVDGYTALPAGTVLHGHVTDVDRAGRVQGRGRLGVRVTEGGVKGRPQNFFYTTITFYFH